jgi:hypothetical protein
VWSSFVDNLSVDFLSVDLLIVGAGAAGIMAAVQGARLGASVMVIEKYLFCGGNATVAGVGTVCGVSLQGSTDIVHEGITREFIERLQKNSNEKIILHRLGFAYLPYRIPDFITAADDFLRHANISLNLDTTVFSVIINQNKIQEVKAICDGTIVTVRPKKVIDCSGSAIVSRLSGIEVLPRIATQACALIFEASGVPDFSEKELGMLLAKEFKRLISCGRTTSSHGLSVVPNSLHNGRVALKLALNATKGTSREQVAARSEATTLLYELSTTVPELHGIYISTFSASLGERSGWCGKGKTVLTEKNVIEAEKNPEEVVKGTWPIEWWSKSQPEILVLPEGDHYSITAGMLRSGLCDNLYFAGRTISGTDRALASARVIGTSCATGEAAARIALL